MTGDSDCNGKRLLFISRLRLLSLANQISEDAQLARAVGCSLRVLLTMLCWGGICISARKEKAPLGGV